MFWRQLGIFVGVAAAVGLLAHFLGQALPRRWFRYDAAPWRAFAWERGGRVYRRVGVERWKDRVPDASRHAGDMEPKRLRADLTAEHVLRLVRETCVAELVHWLLWLGSPLLLLVLEGPWGVALTVLYGLSNLPFLLIQRYNRPRMVKLYGRLAARERTNRTQRKRNDP